ncbi:Predicted arabinose efflux permease, MFS family [Lentzea waywayandensis]|uniref:Predicted arabinose efflux permease, MFS family n=1 Tax=Lentzea waywayandensis TaxID=84724 RepID=A0A1I6DF07_9PSEU|nr:Predicted arabinose efflux permease, MFS family [Lentzea waywayandensis]
MLIGSFVAYMFDALEIMLLSFALPAIRADLGLTTTQGGLLATATLLGIGVSSVTVGWLADNYGRKGALLVSLAVFGVFTAAILVVPSFALFVVLRFLAGMGLGGVWGVVSTYVVETWPAAQRGRAVAFVLSSFPIGGVVAALLSGVLLPDWRLLFFLGGVGVVIPLVIVGVFFRESAEWAEQKTTPVKVSEIFAPELRRRTALGAIVAGLAMFGAWGASTWLPTYLQADKGIPATTVALFLTVLNLGMFVGYNVFGLIADRIGRKNALILSLAGVALTLPLYVIAADRTALLWLGPMFAFFAAYAGIFGAYLGELFPTRVRTTGAGFCFNIGRGVSAFAPLTLGVLAGGAGFGAGLLVCAGFMACAAIVMTFLPDLRSVTTAPAAVRG